MKKTHFSLLGLILLICLHTPAAADTIRQMQYNLMYYTENGAGECDETNNNLNTKDQAFKCIVKNAKPDVLTVNEIGKDPAYPQRILDNVLNTDGVNYFAYAPNVSNPNQGITIGNGLFYDTRKLALKKTFYVATTVSYFNAYRMYYLSQNLAQGDTTFITFIVCHLKAGTECEADRYAQVQKLMNKLQSLGIADNYVLSGDLNIYNASESAYQYLVHHTNPLIRFYDPINREGEWDNNSSFADIFTQSTHTSSPGCFSNGGMDNRFDFILVSDFVLNGTQSVRCLSNTYKAYGQDGLRFNRSINDPANTAVPVTIANALYAMSDHLPVLLDFDIDATLAIPDRTADLNISVSNPVNEQLQIHTHYVRPEQLTIQIYSIDGKLLSTEVRTAEGDSEFSIGFPFRPSVYIVKISDKKGDSVVRKVVKL